MEDLHRAGGPLLGAHLEPVPAGAQVRRAEQAKTLTSHDGAFSSRALFPFDEPRRVEFYELKLAPRGVEHADAHAPGTVENLAVSRGRLEVDVGGATHQLSAGDAIVFEADAPHVYRNPAARRRAPSAAWIMSFGRHAVVLEPERLRAEIVDELNALRDAYGASDKPAGQTEQK